MRKEARHADKVANYKNIITTTTDGQEGIFSVFSLMMMEQSSLFNLFWLSYNNSVVFNKEIIYVFQLEIVSHVLF